MHISFVGISPAAHLRETLRSQAITFACVRSLEPGPTDIILYSPNASNPHKELEALAQAAPNAWYALIVKREQLQEKAFIQAVAEFAPHAVWDVDTWELQLELGLRRIVECCELQFQLSRFEKDYQTLREEHEDISNKASNLITQFERDVALASNIQRSLLPKKTPLIPDILVTAKYSPALGFGGDYYDIFEFGDKKRFGFLLADSKTHGMAAALLTVLVKIRLEEMKDRFPDSKSFVDHLNREIQNVHRKEMNSMSLFYGILDRSSLTLQYTSAGTLTPLLWRLGEMTPLSTSANPALGEANDFTFKESFISLKPADLLLFHTDGLHAVLGVEKDGVREALGNILEQSDHKPDPQAIQNDIMGYVDKFKDSQPLIDDITLIQLFVEEKALYVASESK